MTTIDQIKEQFKQMPAGGPLQAREQEAFEQFSRLGFPNARHEEWKYTRVGGVLQKEYSFTPYRQDASFSAGQLDALKLPGHEEANVLVFVNGIYTASLSHIHSDGLVVQPLAVAAGNEYGELISKHLGDSGRYAQDGIHALNTSFMQSGVFVNVKRAKEISHPLYCYYIADARATHVLAQPRSLIYISEAAKLQVVDFCISLGSCDSFTNGVTEIVTEQDAKLEYYSIQNDASNNSRVSTTHFRQTGRSHIHAVTISLDGGIVRNNLNIALEAEHSEAHLYGLYFLRGKTHVDNHTIVDHAKPNCPSNELYKGILDDTSTAVFNGKIFVRPQAQKTNAYQSNKNILLAEGASVNTKPQLEIFADDVRCSHGCTIGRLDEEGLFYLRARGIPERMARALLVQAFAMDILEHIHLPAIRSYVDGLIAQRLEVENI